MRILLFILFILPAISQQLFHGGVDSIIGQYSASIRIVQVRIIGPSGAKCRLVQSGTSTNFSGMTATIYESGDIITTGQFIAASPIIFGQNGETTVLTGQRTYDLIVSYDGNPSISYAFPLSFNLDATWHTISDYPDGASSYTDSVLLLRIPPLGGVVSDDFTLDDYQDFYPEIPDHIMEMFYNNPSIELMTPFNWNTPVGQNPTYHNPLYNPDYVSDGQPLDQTLSNMSTDELDSWLQQQTGIPATDPDHVINLDDLMAQAQDSSTGILEHIPTEEVYLFNPIDSIPAGTDTGTDTGTGTGTGTGEDGTTVNVDVSVDTDWSDHPLGQGNNTAPDTTDSDNILTDKIAQYQTAYTSLTTALDGLGSSFNIADPGSFVSPINLDLNLGLFQTNLVIDPQPYTFVRSILLFAITLIFVIGVLRLFIVS